MEYSVLESKIYFTPFYSMTKHDPRPSIKDPQTSRILLSFSELNEPRQTWCDVHSSTFLFLILLWQLKGDELINL